MYKIFMPGCHSDRRDADTDIFEKIGVRLALQQLLNGLRGILSIDASDNPLLRQSTSREDRSLFNDFDRSMPDPYTRVCSKSGSCTFSSETEPSSSSSSKSQPMEGKASPSDDETAINMESNSKDSAFEAGLSSSNG